MANKDNKKNPQKPAPPKPAGKAAPKSNDKKPEKKAVYAKKRAEKRNKRSPRDAKGDDFEQQIVDIARVTRVMAGGKRMRFRACVVIGNKKGKVGVGLDKGADVSIAVNKAVNQAKKNLIDVPIFKGTVPHEIFHKTGAAKVLLKPARQGKGVIAGGATRIVLELAGIKNITSKNLGTSNPVNIAKCAIEALDSLKKVEVKSGAKKNQQDKQANKDNNKALETARGDKGAKTGKKK